MARRSYSVPIPTGLAVDSTTAVEAMQRFRYRDTGCRATLITIPASPLSSRRIAQTALSWCGKGTGFEENEKRG